MKANSTFVSFPFGKKLMHLNKNKWKLHGFQSHKVTFIFKHD